LGDHVSDHAGFVGDCPGRQVDVPCGSAGVVGAEKNAALENEPLGMRRLGEAVEEAFEGVDLVELVGRPAGASCQIL
jgi:hypothetical protein